MKKFFYMSKIVKGDKLELIRDGEIIQYIVNGIEQNKSNMFGIEDAEQDRIFNMILKQVKEYERQTKSHKGSAIRTL
jgi:hypothetical protein